MEKDIEVRIVVPAGQNKIMIKGAANAWLDFGILLEAVGMMCAQIAREGDNPKGIKSQAEAVKYAQDYIEKSGNDYQKNWSSQIPNI